MKNGLDQRMAENRREQEFAWRLRDVLEKLTLKIKGEHINRRTMGNLALSGFKVEKEEHVWTSMIRMMVF